MSVRIAGLTDIGSRRESNQDSIDWYLDASGESALAVVADGMGGYRGGEIASRIAVETMMEQLQQPLTALAPECIGGCIEAAVKLAHERIGDARQQQPELHKMGTTLVLAWLHRDQLWLAHLGDSRAYLLREDELRQQTRDDTVAQNMVDDGSIAPEEVPRVPFRNVLTRALGATAEVTISRLALQPGDRIILCSDGLTGALPDRHWPALMDPTLTLAEQAHRLVEASLANHADDNVSVILIQTCDPKE